MGFVGGAALKLIQTLLYAIEFCAAGIVLGIFSWFLFFLHHNNLAIPQWEKAVEGLSGAACLYLIFAILLTCFLGGFSFFAFLGIVLDVLFCGAFIAIAVLTREGADTCAEDAFVRTPIGNGKGSTDIPDTTNLSFACKLNKTVFAVSIIAAGLFLISALIQLAIGKNHQREKRYGPSPANNYTSGSGSRWFRRRRGPRTTHDAYGKDAEVGALAGAGAGIGAGRHSAGTDPSYNHSAAGGYHTAPTGAGVSNPYGYDNTTTTANF